MPSYVVTGVSRGLGLEFLRQIASNPANTVVGLVRNVAETETKISSWKQTNLHIISGDLNDYNSMKEAAEATSKIISGKLDCLIANAAYLPTWSALDPFSKLGADPSHLTDDLVRTFTTNVVGNIHLFNLFMPLILKGDAKKVISISSGMADNDLVTKFGIYEAGPYTLSKSAMNMVMSKFQSEYEKDGVLFLSVSPGLVDTENGGEMDEVQTKKAIGLVAKLMEYAPEFKGPTRPEDAARDVLKVVENARLADGLAGAFLSHLGNKQWV
ncbi:hypothetical protein N0V91_009325 [Didymella pomorum]|uniref:NAD(P)-binding protein n=1 Tax=Didymella pomorum TaxID=749634 RepID=A0A9W9D4H8_9PLEO|nr:hypothetical protein N0V91_009325 [Didymella pomorum]